MERDFLTWFKQMVTVESVIGINAYAEPQYGAAVQYPAFVQYRTKLVRGKTGREVVSSAQVYLDGNINISVQDRITLPDGTQPIILSIESMPDETGTAHHKVVYM